MSKWTHKRTVMVRNPKGLHARPVALLVAHLRKVPPGTRFALGGYRGPAQSWSVEDFGEAHQASVFKVARWGWSGPQEITVLASGPHAEYVLDTAAAIFGRTYGPDDITRTHPDWQEVCSAVGVDEARRIAYEILSAVV